MSKKFAVGICGSVTNPSKKYNPLIYCRSNEGKSLLWTLAHKPKNKTFINKELLKGLLLIEAVRIENGKCYINFPYFLKKDKKIIENVTKKYAIKLAEKIKQKKGRFSKLSKSVQYNKVSADKVLFIAVGCACLDWRGLSLFAEQDYLLEGPAKPGGNNYTLWGQEEIKGSLKELYWGSHNEECGKYTLTSFGDHETKKRDCFPDIFWNMVWDRNKFKESRFEDELYASFKDSLGTWGERIASELLDFKPSKETGVTKLLKKLFYIKNNKINIPILVKKDAPVIKEIKACMDELILDWAYDNYDDLRTELSAISPSRNGVDYRDTFLQIWHYVFGYTNKYLAREGIIFNPYAAGSDFKGYLPAVHENRLNL
ncbi:hypothetical protein ACFL6Y_01300 [Elusimicrobiota bacterium]